MCNVSLRRSYNESICCRNVVEESVSLLQYIYVYYSQSFLPYEIHIANFLSLMFVSSKVRQYISLWHSMVVVVAVVMLVARLN